MSFVTLRSPFVLEARAREFAVGTSVPDHYRYTLIQMPPVSALCLGRDGAHEPAISSGPDCLVTR